MNTQIISKSTDVPNLLEVHSIFPTIQGEGPFVGRPCIFVRLFGCTLTCSLCDTDYTSALKELTPEEICHGVREFSPNKQGYPLVVITGGEPFRQNIGKLIDALHSMGKIVQIETNGTLFADWLLSTKVLPTIICSPKTGSINKRLIPYIHSLKYVVSHDSVAEDDGLPILALGHSAKPRLARPPKNFKGTVYLQPADSEMDTRTNTHETNAINLSVAIRSCMKHGYTLCLQTHKTIGMP